MALVACIGWGSLIWDPRELPIQREWFHDGPIVKIEFVRQSRDGRMTLVLHEQGTPTRSLWSIFDTGDVEEARQALKNREGCASTDVQAWSRGMDAPALVVGLVGWAEAHAIDSVVWTALPPKFSGTARVPTVEDVVGYLSNLVGAARDNAERYVRLAPRQIDTPYRRRIEAALGWTPIDRPRPAV